MEFHCSTADVTFKYWEKWILVKPLKITWKFSKYFWSSVHSWLAFLRDGTDFSVNRDKLMKNPWLMLKAEKQLNLIPLEFFQSFSGTIQSWIFITFSMVKCEISITDMNNSLRNNVFWEILRKTGILRCWLLSSLKPPQTSFGNSS